MKASVFAKVSESWVSLQQREQRVILAGVSIVCVAMMSLFFSTLLQTHNNLREQQKNLQTELLWLQDQAELAARLNNSCSVKQLSTAPGNEILKVLAERNQLTLIRLNESGSQNYRLTSRASEGNNILRFVHQSACQGFELLNISIKAGTEEQTQFEGQMEFSRGS
ncbi:type II secretion system protein M [Gammaproteobacteria bacterium]|nr:type II secretion system protein M [Gammaproteobacteria bacterium]